MGLWIKVNINYENVSTNAHKLCNKIDNSREAKETNCVTFPTGFHLPDFFIWFRLNFINTL